MQLAHIPPRAGSPYAPHPNPHRTGAGTSIAAARPESFAKRTDRHLSPHCSIVLPFGSKGIPGAVVVVVAAVGTLVWPGAPRPPRASQRHDSLRADKGCEEPTCCPLQKPHKGNPPTTPDTPNCRDRCEKDTCSLQLKVELPTAANAPPAATRRVVRSYRTRRQDATATAAEPREGAAARSYCLRLYLRLAAIACS